MTQLSAFNYVTHVDSPSDQWGNKSIVSPILLLILERMRIAFNTPLVVTRGGHTKGHNPNGDHPKGWGTDFYFPKWTFLYALQEVKSFLEDSINDIYNYSLKQLCALGIYPDWKPRGGFHLGLRGHQAMWGRIDNIEYLDTHFPDRKNNYVSYDSAYKYAQSS